MDKCDIASRDEQYLQDRAIEAARRSNGLPSRTECMDCGDKIPEARRQAVQGCCRCVICQDAFERGI